MKTDNKRIEYSNHLVAFLDILGFSQICLSSEKSEIDLTKLEKIFESCEKISTQFNSLMEKQEIRTIIVSDSIVLTLKLKERVSSGAELSNFLLACGKFQYYLGELGFWIRGGVAAGALSVNFEKKQVLGPALIEAVYLEKKVARYPRIVLSPAMMSSVKIENASEFRDWVNTEISDDQRPLFDWRGTPPLNIDSDLPKDVPLFIDFVNCVPSNERNYTRIAESIAIGLRGPSDHYEKYRWLGDYLKASVRQKYIGPIDPREKLYLLLD